MGLGAPALVFAGGVRIAARIWSGVRFVPTPLSDGAMSPPSRPTRWQRRQLLSAMTLLMWSVLEGFGTAELVAVEAGGAGCAAGAETAMPNGVARMRRPGFAPSIIHSAPSGATSTSRTLKPMLQRSTACAPPLPSKVMPTSAIEARPLAKADPFHCGNIAPL